MGGGNAVLRGDAVPEQGLSPRGRGKRLALDIRGFVRGSIPAWAGETLCAKPPSKTRWVYPRVGGGNVKVLPIDPGHYGLSPRGRGKRRHPGRG